MRKMDFEEERHFRQICIEETLKKEQCTNRRDLPDVILEISDIFLNYRTAINNNELMDAEEKKELIADTSDTLLDIIQGLASLYEIRRDFDKYNNLKLAE